MALPTTLRSRKSSESTRVPKTTFTRPRKVIPNARRPIPNRRSPAQQRRAVARGPVNRIRATAGTAAALFGREFRAGLGYWAGASPKKQARRRPVSRPIRK